MSRWALLGPLGRASRGRRGGGEDWEMDRPLTSRRWTLIDLSLSSSWSYPCSVDLAVVEGGGVSKELKSAARDWRGDRDWASDDWGGRSGGEGRGLTLRQMIVDDEAERVCGPVGVKGEKGSAKLPSSGASARSGPSNLAVSQGCLFSLQLNLPNLLEIRKEPTRHAPILSPSSRLPAAWAANCPSAPSSQLPSWPHPRRFEHERDVHAYPTCRPEHIRSVRGITAKSTHSKPFPA